MSNSSSTSDTARHRQTPNKYKQDFSYHIMSVIYIYTYRKYVYIYTRSKEKKKSTPHHCPEPEPRQPSSLSARNRDPNHVCCPPPLYSLLHPDASSPPLPRQCHTLQKVKPKLCVCNIELIYESIHICIYIYIYTYIYNML